MNKTFGKAGHRGFLKQYSLALALLVLCAVLSLKSPAFLTGSNILIVFRQISINAILAIGVTFVILTAGIDLSLGSVVAFAGVLSAMCAHPDGFPLFVPVLAGLTAGMLVGLVNGVVIMDLVR